MGLDTLIDQYFQNHPPASFLLTVGQILNKLGKGDSLAFVSVLLMIAGYFMGKRSILKSGWGGIVTITLVAPIVQTLKHLIGRARPQMNYGEFYFIGPNFFKGGFDSFPSGHSMVSFALATYLSLSYPRGKFFFYSVAISIGLLGRVALRNHFLTDVIVGGIIGYFVGTFVHKWLKPKRSVEETISISGQNEEPPIHEQANRKDFLLDLFLLLIIASAFLFIGLGSVALWDRDETEYGQAVLEMIQNRSWLIPTLEGEPFLEKPILLYWFTKLSVLFFGINDFAFRFPSALLGVLTCLLTYGVGRIVWNRRTGLLSSLILSSSFLFIGCFRLLLTDSLLVFFTLASLTFYILSKKSAENEKLLLGITYLSLGFALLSKGPIAFFPVVIFMIYDKKILKHALYSLIHLAVAAPWFTYSWNFQKGTASNFLMQENLWRFLQGSEGHTHSPLYYIPVLLLGVAPWSYFLVLAFKEEWKQRVDSRIKMEPEIFLLLLWPSFLFTFFSLSAHKLPHYLLPILPPLSCFLGQFWDKSLTSNKRKVKSFLSYVGGSLILMLLLALFVSPKIESFRTTIKIAHSIKNNVPKEAKLFGYHFSEPSLFIYGGRLFPKKENEPLDNLLKNSQLTYIVLPESKLKENQIETPYTIVERAEGFAENSGKITLLLIKNNL